MITDATPEQWYEIEQLRIRWLTTEQTAQYEVSEIRKTVNDMLTFIGHPETVAWVVDSPWVARVISANLDANLRANLSDNLRANLSDNLYANLSDNLRWYCGVWWNAWYAWYQGGEIFGVPRIEQMDLFERWNRHCPVWMWSEKALFVLRRPKEIHWETSSGPLHNDSGPSVYYSPLFMLWHIRGVPVDSQIVMRPETQTAEQIDAEPNADVRSIRLERFGWSRYIRESEAKVVDSGENAVTNCPEALYRTRHGKTNCSAGRCSLRAMNAR